VIRQHITILQTQPDQELLRKHQSKSGFRVFSEKNTGLYYLDFPDDDKQKLPEFGGNYVFVLKHDKSYDLNTLKEFVRKQTKAGTIEKHQFDKEVVDDSLFLSDTFQTRVLCAYHDDEDTDFVAIANNGVLEKMCFSAVPVRNNDMDADYFEVTYSHENPPKLEKVKNNFEGHNSIYQREFLSAFGKPAPDLFFFAQPKPKKENLTAEAKLLGTSQSALLRSHGQFKLVDYEESQIHPALEKLYGVLEIILKIIFIPFILIAVLVVSVRDDIKHTKNEKK